MELRVSRVVNRNRSMGAIADIQPAAHVAGASSHAGILRILHCFTAATYPVYTSALNWKLER
jgi:hypothetical protein